MQKWADYLISEVSYDSDHLISVAIRHKDSPDGVLSGVPVDRLTIASDIKNGITYITIYSGNKSWKKGHNIQTFSIDGIPYLRIDGNKVKLDNLGDLPNVTSVDIQSLGIISEEDANELKQIEQLEKQIQDLESKSLSQLKQSPTREQISIDQNKIKSRQQELEEYENEYLNRIKEQELLLEEIGNSDIESDAKINSSNIHGSLPKGYEIPSKSQEQIPPEQLAQIEQLEKQIQELESQPEPEPEPSISTRGSLPKESPDELPQELDLAPEPVIEEEPGTPEQTSQVSNIQKQIDELENMLSSNFEELLQSSKSDTNLNKIENENSTDSSEKENTIKEKLDGQKQKLSALERKLSNSEQDDVS